MIYTSNLSPAKSVACLHGFWFILLGVWGDEKTRRGSSCWIGCREGSSGSHSGSTCYREYPFDCLCAFCIWEFHYIIVNNHVHIQEQQRKLAEDQMNLVEKQSQVKAEMLRYEDELARKRMQVWESLSLSLFKKFLQLPTNTTFMMVRFSILNCITICRQIMKLKDNTMQNWLECKRNL